MILDDTLTGRTTRPVTFIDNSGGTAHAVRRPAGTCVYVTAHPRTRGLFIIRIPRTLLTQDVALSTVEPF